MGNKSNNLFDSTLTCLMCKEPDKKIQAVRDLNKRWLSGQLDLLSSEKVVRITVPGRPELPVLVNPRDVPKRGFNSEIARIKLVHAITHIEFNAINLALDAVYRFRNMPEQYYTDWLNIAAEEALHFLLLEDS